MANVAILIGNSIYKSQPALPCCANDVAAVRGLLEATGRYDSIESLADADADILKISVREIIDKYEDLSELLFYYTGHGHQHESEFYFCGSNFDVRRPNETGLSNSELHQLVRPANPVLFVKIIDACHSGTPLIKKEFRHPAVEKDVFRSVIQISSCLNGQMSLTGDPLSQFTTSLCKAAINKKGGSLFYTDLIAALRDEYIDNESQTPHFVSQSTGREVFVEDATKLDSFRVEFFSKWCAGGGDDRGEADCNEVPTSDVTPSRLELLRLSEERLVRPEKIKALTDDIFDGIAKGIEGNSFNEMFDLSIEEHNDFVEPTTRGFIIKQLHREPRPDNFVTADIEKKRKKRGAWDLGLSAVTAYYGDDDFDETWTLRLNCRVDRAQMRITLLPKFTLLQKLVLVVTCAPSLERCYVFEMLTSHKRTSFESFDETGDELVRRWYKQAWTHDTTWLIDGVCEKLNEMVNSQIERVSGRN